MNRAGRGPNDYLDLGNWNAICSMCGFKFKASDMVKNWQGMYRCHPCNEARHPQEYVRAVPDLQTPPWTQPPPADVFVALCFPNDTTCIVGYAVVDCVIVDFVAPGFDPSVHT